MLITITPVGPKTNTKLEEFLAEVAASLSIPESRYEQADTSYKSVAKWLRREDSGIHDYNPAAYIQGSFALGTVIPPLTEEEEYDIDMVCEVPISRAQYSQAGFKTLIHDELSAYVAARGMEEVEPMRRCLRLNYSDSAQFHLDVVPAVPDKGRKDFLLKSRGIDNAWADRSITITDEKSLTYNRVSSEWPHSNPQGYREWFMSRMSQVFESRRRALALKEGRANIGDIPEYRVKTPLQYAVQILKRHRDMTFSGHPDDKPVSILITTLAARAYNQEDTISSALYSIIHGMESFIERRAGIDWVENPTDPLENFADKWREYPERKDAFMEWMERVQEDFAQLRSLGDNSEIAEALSPMVGHKVVGRALQQVSKGLPFIGFLNPKHKQEPVWRTSSQGDVKIAKVTFEKSGFRPIEVTSGQSALQKNGKITFRANTTVQAPYEIYWQVVNTGHEARLAGALRGGFDKGEVEVGRLKKTENTLYRGTHTMECFIVKNGLCVARSGQFIVNIL